MAGSGAVAGGAALGWPSRAAGAELQILPTYPNIGVVTGVDPTVDVRPLVRQAIDARASGPLRRGTHDLWFVFPYPDQIADNRSPPNHAYVDPSVAPRPLRGIVDMRRINPDVDAGTLRNTLWTMTHELAHGWLVPNDLKVRQNGVLNTVVDADAYTTSLNNDSGLTLPTLLARGNAHWSCYADNGSPMDGIGWARASDDGGHARWTQQDGPTTTLRAEGLGFPVDGFGARFSDLDLVIMGAKRPEQAYQATGGRFHWLAPKVSIGGPILYHIGICVAFSRTDYVYFGFYCDHRRLRVERSSNGYRSADVDLGPDYRPLRSEYEGAMLRVVRVGTRYYFQACRGNSAASLLGGALSGTRGPLMFDDADAPHSAPTGGDFSRFQTVATLDIPQAPQAIGVITKTWNMILAEGQFFSFETRVAGRNDALPLYNVNTAFVGSDLAGLPTGTLLRHVPQAGALYRRRNFSMFMGVPYTGTYDHWSSADQAPKMLTRAPTGDFAFGSSLKVSRSFVSPWAGGAARGLTVWGRENSADIRDVVVPDRVRALALTPGSAMRTAFIVAARRPEDVPWQAMQRLDVLRRYFGAAWRYATSELVLADTNLA